MLLCLNVCEFIFLPSAIASTLHYTNLCAHCAAVAAAPDYSDSNVVTKWKCIEYVKIEAVAVSSTRTHTQSYFMNCIVDTWANEKSVCAISLICLRTPCVPFTFTLLLLLLSSSSQSLVFVLCVRIIFIFVLSDFRCLFSDAFKNT